MFELAFPLALLLLPLPLLLWYLLPPAKVKVSGALKIPFFNALSKIVIQEKQSPGQSFLILPFLIWSLLSFALASPRWIGEPLPLSREGHNIMLVLDLSASMELSDMLFQGLPASRLAVVKHAAEEFVKKRAGDKIGLILFGTRAYVQTPLTYDRRNVLMRIEDASAGLAGQTTSIGDAVGLAVKRLQAAPEKGRLVILLTDGANNSGVLSPIKAAELAKEEGIKVYTIGLGSEGDSQLPTDLLPNASADLDEESLQQMAKMTNAQYFRATDTRTLHSIYKTIDRLETTKQEKASLVPKKEYYPWFVGLALLCTLYWMAKPRLAMKINSLFQNSEVLFDDK